MKNVKKEKKKTINIYCYSVYFWTFIALFYCFYVKNQEKIQKVTF